MITFEPDFNSLLQAIRESWDPVEFKQKTEPLLVIGTPKTDYNENKGDDYEY